MSTATQTYDVFVSYGLQDRAFAAEFAKLLVAEGLQPFYEPSFPSVAELGTAIWDALAECRAFIAIVSPDSSPDAMGLVELGAATAWQKPIFVLLNGPPSAHLPEAFRSFPAYPRNRLDEVVAQIRETIEPLADTDLQVLADLYRETNIPADRLSQSPGDLKKFVDQFRRKTNRRLDGNQLVSELLRMRKQGKLPKLQRRNRSAEN